MNPPTPPTDWTLPGAADQPIFGTTHLPATDHEPRGVLILCHGFKGYKDYGLLPQLAEHAARAGLVAHRFNFSHSGVTPRHDTFERADLFEQDTWLKQIADLQHVVKALAAGELPGGGGRPFVLFGHSRGGVTALLTAASATPDPVYAPLRASAWWQGLPALPAGVVAAAAPSSACNLDEDQRAMLRRVGRLPSPSSRTGQTLYVGRAWLEEIERCGDALDPVHAAAHLPCPLLIVHGSSDTTVPIASAHALAEAGGPNAELRIIEAASHTFDAPNPLPLGQAPPTATRELIELTCSFALARCAAAPRQAP